MNLSFLPLRRPSLRIMEPRFLGAFLLLFVLSVPCSGLPARADAISGAWEELHALPRTGHSAVYDPIRNRFIVFGGGKNDVWALELDGAPHWVEIRPKGTLPTRRYGHVAIYNPDGDRMIVHGGKTIANSCYSQGYLTDTWALNLAGEPEWVQVATTGGPVLAGTGATAVYDSRRQRMVLYGGFTVGCLCGSMSNAVWALTLGATPTWTRLSPTSPIGMPPPKARGYHAAVYDPAGDRMVVFGGNWTDFCSPMALGDVWALSLGDTVTWTPLSPSGTPPAARYGHVGVFDPARHRMVIFGGTAEGALADSWALELDGTTAWIRLAPSGTPPGTTAYGAAAYDVAADRMIYQAKQETMALQMGASPAWTTLDVAPALPPVRADAASIIDPLRRRLIVFGGSQHGGAAVNDVWAMSLDSPESWQQLLPTGTPPPARHSSVAVYDPEGDRMVIFGGYGAGPLNDTWALDLSHTPAWVQLDPSGTLPYVRYESSAVYDPVHSAMVIFGGSDYYTTSFNDVWTLALDGAPAWTEMHPGGTLPPRSVLQTAVYDPVAARMLVFGGSLSSATWQLTLGDDQSWAQFAPAGSPPGARYGPKAIYESRTNRMVIYGGSTSTGTVLADVWALTLGPDPAWTELAPAGAGPGPRYNHSVAYDSLANRMVVFGGAITSTELLGDTWFLNWEDSSTPTLATLLSASSEDGVVHLRWYSSGPGSPVTLYRRTEATDWQRWATLTADASGFLAFEDRGVSPGARYGYRLGIPVGDQEAFTGEAWVNVPALQLALHGLRPNPSHGGSISVALVLPSGAPAWLEMFDVGGRIVQRRDVGGLGPGNHLVNLTAASALPPGIYWLRLTQGARSLTTRGVLLQ